ncbi:FAD-dependent pyridine nucleotide-disulfide oxidoreductase [Desulfobulbus propionicus DSM 2032]|uniref:FAD-dependent pyridine nucleotide-disulfide oxidoreductase n=1 Tax=Desulfobulbus propionicus (strain ATCC 33891 / DSM 2032 / VKM B-1956 / 1pr3) TaxID=577650 RepID=A0A7U3YKX2_DESPD|nr:FAD-dependent oxidoreductase [Desulfobulbus propionicus]ADW17283.1 FAD-dependent pyridine nucleotide-disulfide oxidoreductase [Desulfobulbus propionicus DSM 2032]
MTNKKIVVIGGSAAGAKAAAKARRLDEFADITIVQKAPDLSMASCGYPYYVGGVFNDRNALLCTPAGVVRDPVFFQKAKKITALVETEVTAINRANKQVTCRHCKSGEHTTLAYDKLVIATGARANMPPIPGIDLPGVTTLLSMADTDYLRAIRDAGEVKRAVVIGGGLIGVEACEALQQSGIQVTVVEAVDQVLTFLDWDLAKLVENHMQAKGVRVLTGIGVKEFVGENGKLIGVKLADGTVLECGLAVMAIGVRPNSELAREARLAVGTFGGITVNQYMQTSDPDIYAGGDCVEIPSRITGSPAFAPMGDLANLEGRVIGENIICGNTATFPGTVHTGICKVFDFSAGSTGLSEKAAQRIGMDGYTTVVNASPDKPGFMGAKILVSKLLVDKEQRILGYQCVGLGDVSRQIATAAMAIQGKLKLADVINADLPYAPPFSPAIDHFITAAHIMENKLKGRMTGIGVREVWHKLQAGEKPFLLDGRNPNEYEEMHLGIGETLIPLGALRARLNELPADKDAEIICFCKISLRGYEAECILRAHGYTNVKVMEGGIMAWPYPREK